MCFSTLDAQILYTENFNSYTIGNLGTDITGTIPGQGGWYTNFESLTVNNPPVGANTNYQIAAESNKGNILTIQNTYVKIANNVFRNDLKTFWQQRSAGNNVLKLAFDYYTGDMDTGMIYFRNKNGRTLFGYWIENNGPFVRYNFPDTPTTNDSERLRLSNGQLLVLPKNTWFTFELYVDYNNSNIYYSIPSLNYTVVYPMTLLDPDGNAENDGVPEELVLRNYAGISNSSNILKIDNINFSAQNTVPVVTVGVNAVLSNSFNLYPNPAKNVVNITNNENRLVQQVAVYDVTGKLINTQNYNNETEIQLNVENLASGTYMLHLQTAEGKAVKKVVKK